jgi:uncharacterized protein YecE (DUF72 family)
MHWYTGCSGFHYKEWKGFFYPEKLPQRQWFEYYSSRFHTLELNVTFYRFPELSFLENWYAKSPDHFLFSVKAPRLITHYKKFRDTGSLLEDFYTTIRKGLRDKLGPVLFQLPPQQSFTEEALQLLIKSMDTSFDNVVEFRHASWWQKQVIAELGKNGITFCGISYPGLPDEIIINTGVVYYRFHGVPKLYYSAYTEKEMEGVVKTIGKSKKAKEAYVYFNNTAGGAAIKNAVFLENRVSGKTTGREKYKQL